MLTISPTLTFGKARFFIAERVAARNRWRVKFAPVNGNYTPDDIRRVLGIARREYIAQEKLDGVRAWLLPSGILQGRNSILGSYSATPVNYWLDGELMPSGEFIAFDVLQVRGRDVTQEPIESRLALLDTLPVKSAFRALARFEDFAHGIVAAGGEGVVLKLRGSTYNHGGWLRFKRRMTVDAVVADVHEQSVELVAGGKAIGRAQCFCEVLPGDVVEVEAMQWTRAGKLRHGRVVRVRTDKSANLCA